MIKTSHATWVAVIPMLILTWYFSGMMDEYHTEQMRLQERVWQLEDDCGYSEADKIAFNVTVTTYNPTEKQCDSTPNITADGTRIRISRASDYKFVALSRNLLKRWGGPFDYGDFVLLKHAGHKDGVYQVRDTMNPKWVNVVDILESKDVEPYKFTNAHIFKLPWVGIEKEG